MTFLNPFLLLGLAAAAVPLLIHLLNFRKLRTVQFSSLRFLKELQKTQIRRVKLRQLLLLILRTLAIICLVLAFARPALHGTLSGPIGTRAKSTIVILLDDSPSMTVRNENGILFQQAKDVVRNLLKLVSAGDEVYLLPLSHIRHTETFAPAHSVESVASDLDQASPTLETFTYRDAFGAIAKIVSGSHNINQEVYVVSDGQASQFQFNPQDAADLFNQEVKFFLIDVSGSTRPENVGVASLSIGAQIASIERPLTLDVTLQNSGSRPAQNALLSAYLDGKRVAQQSFDIPVGGSSSRQLVITPKRGGVLAGYLQLEDDALESDNRYYFVITVPEKLRAALVGSGEATRFPSLALSAVRELGAESSVAIDHIDEMHLSSLNVATEDVIMLCGITSLSTTEADRIAQFVRGGGGLVVFPGDKTDTDNFNHTLFSDLGIPLIKVPENTNPKPESDNGEQGFRSFGKVDLDHPLFAGLFEEGRTQKPAIESPQVYRAIRSSAGRTGNVLIELSDNTPFLTEYPVGTGRVLLFAVDPGISWSDFAVKGIYAPLLHRCLSYLTTGDQNRVPVTVGDPATLTARIQNAGGQGYLLRTPSGLFERVIPHINPVTGLTTFSSSAAHEAGVYELHTATGEGESARTTERPMSAVAVNIDPRESNLARVTGNQFSDFCSAIGIDPPQREMVSGTGEIGQTVLESRFGVELWKQMVAAAILFLLIEMAVARTSKNELPSGQS